MKRMKSVLQSMVFEEMAEIEFLDFERRRALLGEARARFPYRAGEGMKKSVWHSHHILHFNLRPILPRSQPKYWEGKYMIMMFMVSVLLLLFVSCCSAFKTSHRVQVTIPTPLSSFRVYVMQQQPTERKKENVFQELLRAFLESLPWTMVRVAMFLSL